MERTWLEVGKDYTSGNDRVRVEAAIEALEWRPSTGEGPMSPVLMLQSVVTGLRLPKVSAIAWGGGEANVLTYPDGPETATYTVLGVESNYSNGRARLYVLDTGVAAVPLACDYPVPASSPEPAEPAKLPDGLFLLGTVVATPGAIERMEHYGMDPAGLLARHLSGDWGDIHPDDRGLNERALRCGDRLLSVYGEDKTGEDSRIWIITEADRSATTILRPEDY
jgi:hypothetical protein